MIAGCHRRSLGTVDYPYLRAQADRMGKELTVRAEAGVGRTRGRLVWVLALGDSELTAVMDGAV